MFSKDMSKLFGTILILILSGCSNLSTGEGIFIVTGEIAITTRGSNKCILQLLADGQAVNYNIRPILGAFKESFVVSSEEGEYTLNVSCGGNLIGSRVISYPGNIGIGGAINLGQMVSGDYRD